MNRSRVRDAAGVAALTIAAILLHGYHFGIEDQTLYVPAVEKKLDPSLFPYDSAFFVTQTKFTWFDELTAGFVRLSHLPLDVVVFCGQVLSLSLLIVVCRRLLRYCFDDRRAEWSGLALLVILLPFPVAGTRFGLMEQYFHPRGLAIALAALAFFAAIEGRAVAIFWLAAATAIHPLAGVWSALHVACQSRRIRSLLRVPLLAVVVLAGLSASCDPVAKPPPDSNVTYWKDLLSPEVFDVRYPLHWPWYEWLGVIAPIAILVYYAYARLGNRRLADVTRRLLISATVGVLLALAITASPDRRWPVQPMRELHLVYIVVIAIIGARIDQVFVGQRSWRRLMFVVLAAAVFVAQRHYPSSPHVEWPGRLPQNRWVEAFDWARQHTRTDALFALDPFYLRRPGPDSHSFRVFAERSMMAEAVHDLAPAAMSPALTEKWMTESRELAGWRRFTRDDFARLERDDHVSWVIVEQGRRQDLVCPYVNEAAAVCRLD